jgi:ketosteroid isomerase-like protein
MADARLQTLMDQSEIVDVLSRYAAGVDRRDAALYRSCFTDELEVDMLGHRFGRLTAQDWVEKAMAAVSVFQATQHLITNHRVEIRGDEATCTAYLQAQHWNPDGSLLIGGTYTNSLVRCVDGWRISRLVLTQSWSEKH